MKFLQTTLAVGLISFSSTLFAQEGFSIGIKGMPQNTWLLNQDDSDAGTFGYVSTWGSAFGIALHNNFGEAAGLEIDILYSQQGQKFELKTPGGDLIGEGQTKVTYLKIPVLFAFSSNPGASTQFYGTVGPQFSLLQKAEGEFDGEEFNDISADVELKDAYSSLDIGAVLSLGAQFSLNDELTLKTGLRLDYGFTDAEDKDLEVDGSPYHEDGRAKTSNALGGLEIGLFYKLN